MKKLLVSVLVAFLLMATLIAAPPMPAPVVGYVEFNGVPVDGVNVIVTNKNTGEVLTSSDVASLRSERGKFAFDLLYFKQGFMVQDRRGSGDVIEIKVCELVPECTYSFEIVSTEVKTVELKIVSGLLPQPIVVEKEVPVEVIKEVEVVTEVEKVVEVPVVVCADGTEVPTVDECPLTKVNVIAIMTAAGIGGAALAFASLVAYWWKKNPGRARKMLATFLKKKSTKK